jgi:protein-disulfide isomerase
MDEQDRQLTKEIADPERPLNRRERKILAKEERRKVQENSKTFSKMKNWIILILVIAVIGFGGMKFWKWINTPTVPQTDLLVLNENDHIKGNPDAATTLIEYADYECPACAVYAGYVNQLDEELGENFKLVFRNLPLVSIHKNAIPAAKAAEAADAQGKFWDMHNKLFEAQSEWESESNPMNKFVDYANDLGLDIEKFQTDYDSSQVQDKVNADLLNANQLRLNSTPTFFLDGTKITVPADYSGFRKLVEDAIQDNQ